MIFQQDHFQAIGQYGRENLLPESGLCQRRGKETKKEEKKKAIQLEPPVRGRRRRHQKKLKPTLGL
jgi:hypothetical protein